MSKKTKGIIITLLIIIIALVIGGIVFFLHQKPQDTASTLSLDTSAKESTEASQDELSSILAKTNISFAGINNIDNGTKTTPVNMPNVKENDKILMRFTITDASTGEQVYKSGLVKSGEYVQWIPGETYGAGTYTFSVKEEPFYPYNGKNVPLTSGSNAIKVTIK